MDVISTLVNLKDLMVARLLMPAGVPPTMCKELQQRRKEDGFRLSKREMAAALIDELRGTVDYADVIHSLIELAANWQSFHLAQHEHEARATCMKAREVLGRLEVLDAYDRQLLETERQQRLARAQKQHLEELERQSDLLLMMLDQLHRSNNPQERGYLLEQLLTQLGLLHELPVVEPFTRNRGTEQIDGAFRLDGWHYLVECRWRADRSGPDELDTLLGKVGRSGKQAMGLFLAINGWTPGVITTLKQNPSKCIVLMDGYDLRTALAERVDMSEFIRAKSASLTLKAEPFLSVVAFLELDRKSAYHGPSLTGGVAV